MTLIEVFGWVVDPRKGPARQRWPQEIRQKGKWIFCFNERCKSPNQEQQQ
jgi:hypothetical protein